jgi:hypothetical protein
MSDKPTIGDMMAAYAQHAVDFAQAKFGETLDYSERNVQKVESCLRQLYDAKPKGFLGKLFGRGPSDDDVLTVAKMFGGYVGEVVRRHHGGEWVLDEETYSEHAVIAIHHPSGKLFPSAKVHMRLINGDEDNVWVYYQVLTREYFRPPKDASKAMDQQPD